VTLSAGDLDRCATSSRALLWNPYVEVAGVSAETSGGLGSVLVLARGVETSVRVAPPTFFGPLVAAEAPGGVLVHTHCTDGPPTADDLAVTRRLVAAGAVLGIPLVAHLVIGPVAWWELVDLSGRHEYPHGLVRVA